MAGARTALLLRLLLLLLALLPSLRHGITPHSRSTPAPVLWESSDTIQARASASPASSASSSSSPSPASSIASSCPSTPKGLRHG